MRGREVGANGKLVIRSKPHIVMGTLIEKSPGCRTHTGKRRSQTKQQGGNKEGRMRGRPRGTTETVPDEGRETTRNQVKGRSKKIEEKNKTGLRQKRAFQGSDLKGRHNFTGVRAEDQVE